MTKSESIREAFIRAINLIEETDIVEIKKIVVTQKYLLPGISYLIEEEGERHLLIRASDLLSIKKECRDYYQSHSDVLDHPSLFILGVPIVEDEELATKLMRSILNKKKEKAVVVFPYTEV